MPTGCAQISTYSDSSHVGQFDEIKGKKASYVIAVSQDCSTRHGAHKHNINRTTHISFAVTRACIISFIPYSIFQILNA